MKLNLGCGKDIRKGWVNLDLAKGEGIDVCHDLNEIHLPIYDDKFDLVLCQDVLEHVNYVPLVNDVYRILKKNGIFKIRVPHFTSKLTYEDPTHKNQFSLRTFEFFIKNEIFKYERNINFYSKIKKKLIFDKSNLFLRIFNTPIQNWVNKSERRQNLYENSFLRTFPAQNIEVELIK